MFGILDRRQPVTGGLAPRLKGTEWSGGPFRLPLCDRQCGPCLQRAGDVQRTANLLQDSQRLPLAGVGGGEVFLQPGDLAQPAQRVSRNNCVFQLLSGCQASLVQRRRFPQDARIPGDFAQVEQYTVV